MKFTKTFILFISILLLASACIGDKEMKTLEKKAPVSLALFNEILELDTKLFDAFNARDLESVDQFFSKDLEFYHDQEGLLKYEQNMTVMKSLLSGETKVTRKLIEGSLEVYPINNYGAIQIGKHAFYNQNPGEAIQLMGKYKFTHVWQKKDGQWQITRILSYDH